MRQSQLFTKTLREVPRDEESINANLLTRGGFIDKTMAGSYSFLPLGLRVLNNISNIVREEMNAIGGQEILMSMLHPKRLWEKTGAWDSVDVLFKIKSRTRKEYALGQSEEEVVTPLAMKFISTYQNLPLAAYQIHWKFRDELRAKSGVLRGREFLMKDMYSFHEDQEDFERFYEMAKKAYLRIYGRMGLTAKVTEASGGSFSEKISYEFMVLTDAGEDDIFYCEKCDFCVNVDILKGSSGAICARCGAKGLSRARACEVGNVFDLGQKYGKDFNLTFLDRKNARQYPVMGCYGIGITRLMGVIVETMRDTQGIIWPESVAPFLAHIVEINSQEKNVKREAERLYERMRDENIAALYDDRQEKTPGEKFADADLIGIPWRVVVSERTLKEKKIEVRKRSESEAKLLTLAAFIKNFPQSK